MSEKKETPEKAAPASHPPKKQRDGSSSSGAFLAMAIALCAAGGSYYLWQQHLVAERDRQALEQSIEQLLQVVEERDQAQQARIEQLRQHQHEELEQRLNALEQSLPDLSQQLSLQQRKWGLAEVDYLLRTAEHRLQLNHDIPTAITALSQARDQLLTHTDNRRFAEVIAAIEKTISTLANLEQNALGLATSRLGELIAAVDTLPFAIETARKAQQAEPLPPLAADATLADKLKRWGGIVWRDLKSLVTIRRNDEVSRPLLEPQQRYLLQTQLRIKLESARLAAIDHNQPLYRATLDEATILLHRYFDSSDPAVIESLATLKQLSGLQIDPQLPSLGALRQMLHTAMLQPPTGQPQPSEPEAAERPPQPQPPVVPSEASQPPADVPQWGREL
jgi:uroporphyrin-3 C-methyltransferase